MADKLQWSERQPGGIYSANVPDINGWFQILEPTEGRDYWQLQGPGGLVVGCGSLEEAKRFAEKRLKDLRG